MRIRTVKPDYWNDDKIGQLTRDSRLLFVATWNVADDEGLLRWTPEYLKSTAFMYDEDIGMGEMSAMMCELVSPGLVHPYSGGTARQKLAYVVNFRKHQKINRPQPSKLPPPSVQSPNVADMYLRRDGWTCYLCGGPIPALDGELPPLSAFEPVDLTPVMPSLDHCVPRSAGGSDYPSNIRIAHVSCNKSRRERTSEGFEAPPSVARVLRFLEGTHPEVLARSLSTPCAFTEDSVTSSVSRSVNESTRSVTNGGVSSTESENPSLNGSVNRSSPEREREEEQGKRENLIHPPSGGGARDARAEHAPAIARPRESPTTRGTRLPVDFHVTPDMVAWAREKTPGVDGRRETERFIDYWSAKTGKDATKRDWVATWRNWMRTAHDRLPVNRRSGFDESVIGFEAMKDRPPWQLQAIPGGRAG